MIYQIDISKNILDYIRENSLRENNILRELREETSNLAERNMQISPEQGQFLSILIKILNARKTLEIGVFTGYSTLCTALALPANGKIVACDCNDIWLTIAKKYWQKAHVENKIERLEYAISKSPLGPFKFTGVIMDENPTGCWTNHHSIIEFKGQHYLFYHSKMQQ